jgi:hypothetical protein
MKSAVLAILLLFTLGTAVLGLVEVSRGEPGATVLAAGSGILFTLAAVINAV